MDGQTFAVALTFCIDLGVALFILIGFFIYRKCRGDEFVRRHSLGKDMIREEF